MKKILLNLCIVGSILSTASVQASCQGKYLEGMQSTNDLGRYIDNHAYELQWIALMGSYVLYANPVVGLVVYTLPLSLWVGSEIADSIHDERLEKMIRIINYSEYKTGVNTPPTLRDDYVTVIDVDGETRFERRNQRGSNRYARSNNRRVESYNKDIERDLAKSKVNFEELHAKLVKVGSNISQFELAGQIAELNHFKSLCDGTVGTIGINPDRLITRNYVVVDGETKKERRAQRRQNNSIETHNKRAFKKLNKNILADEKDIINYLK